MCTRDEWYVAAKVVKVYCSIVAVGFIKKFGRRFPSQELKNVTRIIYPQYWLNFDAETMFPTHIFSPVETQYCFEKEFGDEGLKPPTLLNEQKLDMGTSLFKLTMHANNKQALEPPLTSSFVITLWSNIGFSVFLK